MAHTRILDNSRSALLVVDVQEGFRTAIPDFSLIASRISTAVRGFTILERPVLVTVQYPKGLGHTAEEIQLVLPESADTFEKKAFSSCGASGFVDSLRFLGIEQVIVCGIETHICVNQTAHDLLNEGFQVHLLTDCVASRFEHDKLAGLQKMFGSGAIPSSIEMALFELMRDAGHGKFKEIQALIK
ncbi:MAG TPA: isochorismatase family protein [Pyrinomonadaceae bacterium]|nr:isochorismatase family protein [Pyrinomonadaceae bacterium]